MRMKWTEDKVAILKEGVIAGKSAGELASLLGCTTCAVETKRSRLDLRTKKSTDAIDTKNEELEDLKKVVEFLRKEIKTLNKEIRMLQNPEAEPYQETPSGLKFTLSK